MRLSPLLAAAYLSLAALATPAAADLEAARPLAAAVPGLRLLEAPVAPPGVAYTTEAGEAAVLADHAGAVTVVNFWATWCAPCLAEMPALQRLDDSGAARVVTLAFGRHDPAAMEAFWDEAGIETLPLARDASTDLARALGVRGLPHSVIQDADGRIVAELVGEAHWDAPAMLAFLEALAGP